MRGRQADIKFRHPCYIRHFLAVSGMKIRGSLRGWGGGGLYRDVAGRSELRLGLR